MEHIEKQNIMVYDYSEKGVAEMVDFFSYNELPETVVQLNPWTKILNCGKFVEDTMCLLQNHVGQAAYLPYYDLVYEFVNYLNNQKVHETV
jgi:hypothetical protein